MTATKQFIQDAIAGGWRTEIPQHQHQSFIDGTQGDIRFMVIDPLAWQAVGKTRGWSKHLNGSLPDNVWKDYLHRFIDYLADGKSIEEALEIIFKV